MKDRSHDEAMVEVFREDPAYAAELLNSILEDGDSEELMTTLRQIAEARGGFNTVARQAHLNPENSSFPSFIAMLRAMGLRLSVRPAVSSAPAG